jgi:hypothetical protein
MSESKHTATLPVPVKDSPHWRVVIRPDIFEPERISTLSECWNLVESCRVSLRGWDYPHVARDNRANGADWIASWSEFRGHQEYWRLYQSGQFVHLFTFTEDAYRDEAEKRAKSSIRWMPEDFSPSGYLSVFSTLYSITEIFEFAARLAHKGVFGGSVVITIQMTGIKDRVLFVWDWIRAWDGFYPAAEDTLAKEWSLETRELLSRSAELALDTAVWFFERFQWMDPSPELLANEQQKFLERRI